MDWNGTTKPEPPKKGLDDFLEKLLNNPKHFAGLVVAAVVAAGALSSFYKVNPEEEAVVTRFGRYLSTEGPGPHFKLPFGIDKVQKLVTNVPQVENFGLGASRPQISSSRANLFATQSRLQKRSKVRAKTPPSESLMLTGDLNVANVKWQVQYVIKNPRNYLFNVRDPQKNIRDISQATMRRVVGDLTVNSVLTDGRVRIQSDVERLMQDILDEYKMGVDIREVLLQDVLPPAQVRSAFEEVNRAKQEQEQAINNAKAYYNRIIPESRGKAEQAVTEARGYAAALRNTAKGDAAKFSKVLTEYKKAPEVTRSRLYLELVESLLNRFEQLTIIDPTVKGVLPIFGQNQQISRAMMNPSKIEEMGLNRNNSNINNLQGIAK